MADSSMFGLDSPLTFAQYAIVQHSIYKSSREDADRRAREAASREERRSELSMEAAENLQEAAVSSIESGMEELSSAFYDSTRELVDAISANAKLLSATVYESSKALGANYSYGVGLLVDELRESEEVQRGIAAELSAIHETLRTPLKAQVAEFVKKGFHLLSRGLPDKALEAFDRALALDDTETVAQYEAGRIRLFGVADEAGPIIDVERAIAHLKDARRYAAAELRSSPQTLGFYLEICFTLGVARYVRAVELRKSGEGEASLALAGAAAALFGEVIEKDRSFSEALFQRARCHHLAGDAVAAASDLDRLVRRRWQYLDKIREDVDLARYHEGLRERSARLMLAPADLQRFADGSMRLPAPLGRDRRGGIAAFDMAACGVFLIHVGSGVDRSSCEHALIRSLIARNAPGAVRLALLDFAGGEYGAYDGIPHLLTPVQRDLARTRQCLQYFACELARRAGVIGTAGLRSLDEYNGAIARGALEREILPSYLFVAHDAETAAPGTGSPLRDALGDLISSVDLPSILDPLRGDDLGMHLVIVSRWIDLRELSQALARADWPLTAMGIEETAPADGERGAVLGGEEERLRYAASIPNAPIPDSDLAEAARDAKRWGTPDYIDDELYLDDDEEADDGDLDGDLDDDPLYRRALEIVRDQGKASPSYIQRKLKIGYGRAARFVDHMEARGIVGPAAGSQPRRLIGID